MKPVVSYHFYRSPLGWMLLAATPRGLCSATFQPEGRPAAHAAAAELQALFPELTTVAEAGPLAHVTAALTDYFQRRTPLPLLPIDWRRGTPFQQRVWRALRTIPFGSTCSYGELARRIGAPGAARAVGQACGRNPLVVFVPCHRVIRRDGKLGGYSSGIHRKGALLAHEAPSA
jgi:AraC family transcriptional regulator of adaptative response/methylated-DNA-[protein]-cysteine methyltransferase